jgi:hypothetical protein
MVTLTSRFERAWARRLRLGDALSTLTIEIPGSATEDPNNPMRKIKGPSTTLSYPKVLGGWNSLLQESDAGLRYDRKQGRCVLPLFRFKCDMPTLRAQLSAPGARLALDGEAVRLERIEHDPLSGCAVLYLERIEG